jgi:hypothetical protein
VPRGTRVDEELVREGRYGFSCRQRSYLACFQANWTAARTDPRTSFRAQHFAGLVGFQQIF